MKQLAKFKVMRKGDVINFYIWEKGWWKFGKWIVYGSHASTTSDWAENTEKAFLNFQRNFLRSYNKHVK